MDDLKVYERSRIEAEAVEYFLARGSLGKVLCVRGQAVGFHGERQGDLLVCPLTEANAVVLRVRLPWLRPQPLGLQLSAGCGDRLGPATPGHLRAVAAHNRRNAAIAPILAQQSMRENARTGRSPRQVMDDAMWGVFQEGWREPWGADADHLKTTADIDLCVAVGYTFYTVDPGDHVVDEGNWEIGDWGLGALSLPWEELGDSPDGLRERYLGRRFEIEEFVFEFDEASLTRAAAKYGRALAHTARMYYHLAAALPPGAFELEVSVDETEAPTSPLEHIYIALELRRLGVQWVSLAPRYVGRFEKGSDYIGDLKQFDAELAQHAAIARVLGPYKLSIHSGSDKFSVYPLFSRHAGQLVHLKTAGTSYLEALRAIARVDPGFFREILSLARERYDEDRATYHVSAEVGRVPRPEDVPDEDLPGLLDQFDAREVLHVTFGSVLDHYRQQLMEMLAAHEEEHYAALEAHFKRHLASFG